MTHYLLTVHGPAERNKFGTYSSKEEMEEAFAATGAFKDKLHADGYWVFAGGLQPAATATVVDGLGETPVMTDGPYLETNGGHRGFLGHRHPRPRRGPRARGPGVHGLPRKGRGPSVRRPRLSRPAENLIDAG